jgi:hypothetical protein
LTGTYEFSRPDAKLDQVVANVGRIIDMRPQPGAARPQIAVNSVVVEKDVKQIRALFDEYDNEVDGISLKPSARYGHGVAATRSMVAYMASA